MATTIQDLIEKTMSVHSVLWSTAGWFVIYLVALFVLLYTKGFRTRGRSVAIAMVVVLTIVYNPLVILKMQKYFAGSIEYTRIGWAALMVPIIGYVMANLVVENGQKAAKLITIMVGVVLLVTLNSGIYYRMPENIYKIDTEAIEIVDIMNSASAEEGTPYVAAVIPVDTLMRGPMSEYDYVYSSITSYTAAYYLIAMYGAAPESLIDGFQYVLTERDAASDAIEAVGYQMIGQTKHCKVFQRIL